MLIIKLDSLSAHYKMITLREVPRNDSPFRHSHFVSPYSLSPGYI